MSDPKFVEGDWVKVIEIDTSMEFLSARIGQVGVIISVDKLNFPYEVEFKDGEKISFSEDELELEYVTKPEDIRNALDDTVEDYQDAINEVVIKLAHGADVPVSALRNHPISLFKSEMLEEEKKIMEGPAFADYFTHYPVPDWDDDGTYPEPASDMSDNVNHPSHYAEGWSNGAEVIDITEHLNFNRGNAVKYITRAGKKDQDRELEDLQKAAWYLNREIMRLGGTV